MAVEGEEILGFIELSTGGQITAFYSHHAHQRRGIGTALYRHVEAGAKATGIDAIQVQSSITAQNFFLSQGFETIERKVTEHSSGPVIDFVMGKELR
ncbi:GNAT family N-acetyltransferase [Alphaproteobacteria bacterium]|nr:GNAT family N-acetyltransferase [Alphaproteobacteria bacterium]